MRSITPGEKFEVISIDRKRASTVVHIHYERREPIVYNASVVLTFDNADGLLVTKRDDAGRVIEARTVRYLAKQEPNQAAKLERQAGDEVVIYEYASADDRVGKVKARKKAK